ncbi:MAG: twin-arginine translocase TatA/TatE family subunit [Candidatus Pacebacteria bacterium]|nr:twin-arginine translocase TatA/TatE family subunit [Candidatus Paceibacterota bacterium]
MFGNIGMKEIIIIAVILLILFGSKKIPELSRNIVDAIKHLRGAFKDTPADTNDKKRS